MKKLILRSVSGIIYVTVFAGCILLGPETFWILTIFLILLGLYEYMRMASQRIGQKLGMLSYMLPSCIGLLMCFAFFSPFVDNGSGFYTALVFLFAAILCLLCRSVTTNSPIMLRLTYETLAGIVYIALPLSLLNIVYNVMPHNSGRILILVSLICIWINDTGAFCVGCTIGKRKLCQRLSPNKSWEGFWGGLVLVVVSMAIYALITKENVAVYALYGAFISVVATIGDLFESMLKRTAGVKDSGKLIPGHGGILDRIDSFLFVAYAIIIFAIIKTY